MPTMQYLLSYRVPSHDIDMHVHDMELESKLPVLLVLVDPVPLFMLRSWGKVTELILKNAHTTGQICIVN